MSKQTNKALIGGFVLGAVILVIAGVLIFGSAKFMQQTEKFVLFFKGSVKGLNVGASVLFRGVKIGSVSRVTIEADTDTLAVHIPVIIEIEPNRVKIVHGDRLLNLNLPRLIKKGLRGQLTIGSLVTGQLMIELEFYPDSPVEMVGVDMGCPEIPTIPSAFEQISDIVKKLPIKEFFDKLMSAVEEIETLVKSPEIKDTLKSLNMAARDASKLVQGLNSRIDPLVSSIDETVKEYGKLARDIDRRVGPLASGIDGTLKDTRKLVRDVNGRVETLASIMEKGLKQAQGALEQAEKTLTTAQEAILEDSPLIYKVDGALKEISLMARSVRSLADFLERHPEALLYGKGDSEGR